MITLDCLNHAMRDVPVKSYKENLHMGVALRVWRSLGHTGTPNSDTVAIAENGPLFAISIREGLRVTIAAFDLTREEFVLVVERPLADLDLSDWLKNVKIPRKCDVRFVLVGDNGHFKLVNMKTKEETRVAGYRQIAYLDGFVGSTGYYGTVEGVMPADEWLQMNAITKL